jgi:uncharacterized protein (DUF697 family)/GTPase SAR1 family protein
MFDAHGDGMGTFDVGEEVRKQVEKALKEQGKVNVVIAGRSGVGKSTLINAVFQGQLAETGQGRPVTPNTREITKEGIPLTVFDTRGLEMDRYKDTLSDLDRLLKERTSSPDPMRHLHVAWLCVAEDSRRVEEGESKLHEMLAAHMPVLGVVTKARSDQGFRVEVQRLLPQARNIVRVRALSEQDDEGNILKPRGLAELVDATTEVVPEGQRNAFAAAQRVSTAQKRMRAHSVVVASATTAAGIALTPIPFSDAILLVPVQIGMLASISAVFGLPLSQAFLTTLVGASLGAGGGALAGRAIVSGLLKLIPGVGTVAGVAIAATTASTLTTLLGEAYIGTLQALFEESGGAPPNVKEITEAFGSALKRRGPCKSV